MVFHHSRNISIGLIKVDLEFSFSIPGLFQTWNSNTPGFEKLNSRSEPEFENLIDKNLFLDINKSLTTILGAPEEFKSYNQELQDAPHQFEKQKYFIKNDNHPNERGHERIAGLLRNKLNELHK